MQRGKFVVDSNCSLKLLVQIQWTHGKSHILGVVGALGRRVHTQNRQIQSYKRMKNRGKRNTQSISQSTW